MMRGVIVDWLGFDYSVAFGFHWDRLQPIFLPK